MVTLVPASGDDVTVSVPDNAFAHADQADSLGRDVPRVKTAPVVLEVEPKAWRPRDRRSPGASATAMPVSASRRLRRRCLAELGAVCPSQRRQAQSPCERKRLRDDAGARSRRLRAVPASALSSYVIGSEIDMNGAHVQCLDGSAWTGKGDWSVRPELANLG